MHKPNGRDAEAVARALTQPSEEGKAALAGLHEKFAANAINRGDKRAAFDEEREAIVAEGEPANDAPNPIADAGTEKKRARLAAMFPVTYALAEKLPRFEWLCEELNLIRGRVIGFHGYGDAGKTFAAMDMELSVVCGGKAWGSLDIGLYGDVVHLDFEQQEEITRWRFQRLAYARGIDLATLGTRLGLVSLPPAYLTHEDAEEALVLLLTGKVFSVIDNLTAGCPAIEQNGTVIAAPLYMLGRVSARTGCTIVIIHHDNKQNEATAGRPRSQAMRGSGAIHAALGGAVAFTAQEGSVRYEQSKATMGEAREARFFAFVDVGDVDPNTKRTLGIRLEWTPPEEAAEIAQRGDERAKAGIRAYLAIHAPCSKSEVKDKARGASRKAITICLDAMIEDGEIGTTSGPRGALLCSLPAAGGDE